MQIFIDSRLHSTVSRWHYTTTALHQRRLLCAAIRYCLCFIVCRWNIFNIRPLAGAQTLRLRHSIVDVSQRSKNSHRLHTEQPTVCSRTQHLPLHTRMAYYAAKYNIHAPHCTLSLSRSTMWRANPISSLPIAFQFSGLAEFSITRCIIHTFIHIMVMDRTIERQKENATKTN